MTTATDALAEPFGTLAGLIALHAAARPDHPAIIAGDARLHYAGFDATIDRVAAALQREGVAGSVAVCATASIAYLCVFLGALRAGVAVAPLSPSATPSALAAMIADCGAALVFVDAEVATLLAGEDIAAPVMLLDTAGFDEWLGAGAPTAVAIDPQAPFNIIYSSGTTGAPKGIVQSHAMRWAHVGRGAAFRYGPDTVTLVSTPLYSNTTLVSVIPTLANGGTIVLMPKFDARGFVELAAAHRVTHAMLVPVQYRRIMALPDFADFDLSATQMKFATSAPFPAALKADVLARWPGGLVEYFGMTEGGGTCILIAHDHPDKLDTVGRPAPGHDIRLIDDAGREVGPGETGEIVGRSPGMMTGYHNLPGKTAEATWISPDGLSFIRTGDIGRFDGDGFLTLLDRKKDMIISGGFNIYPSDLEGVLAQAPGVVEAAVVGVPSEAWGETPVAFIVTGGDPEAARAWANERLGKTQRLSAAIKVDALPRSAIGKVLKRELRDLYRG